MLFSSAFLERYLELALPVVSMTAMIAGGIWFFLFAATLGFDPPLVIRLIRRWAGAVCLCVFPLFLVPVAGRWFLMMLDIALLPLVGAVGLTLKYRHARQSRALEAVDAA